MSYSKLMCALTLLIFSISSPLLLHAQWIDNGIAVISATGTQDQTKAATDGSGGAIIVWRDYRTANTDIYAQRVDAAGSRLWLLDGQPVCTANQAQSSPLAIPDGSGGAIVVWQDYRNGSSLAIYAQKLSSSGYGQWTGNGVQICAGQTGLTLSQIVSDGSGGAIVTWQDRRTGTNQVFAQKVNSSGTVQWTANGVLLCAGSGAETSPALTSDGAGGAIVAWQDNRDGYNLIYAQRIDASGTLRWGANGLAVCPSTAQQSGPQVVSDGSSGAVIVWADYRNGVDYDIYAQRLDSTGSSLWASNGVAVCALPYAQNNCLIVEAAPENFVLLWSDSRSTQADLYAQRLSLDGSTLWTANGVAVCTASGSQSAHQIVAAGSAAVIATWQDARNGTSDYQIYAQKISENGNMLWTANGVPVCTASGNQTSPAIAPDGVGGAIISWQDARGANTDIYAQRVDAAGHTVVGTLLAEWSAAPREGGIEIRWRLSNYPSGLECFVSRANVDDRIFEQLPSEAVERENLSFVFFDASCKKGLTYIYRVEVSIEGKRSLLFETGPLEALPTAPVLRQNYPNPFNPSTTISFSISSHCSVTLDVCDVSGRLVRRLLCGHRESGEYSVLWNGNDEKGNPVASGIYYCKLVAGKKSFARPMVLMR